jgi:hypothetical protein
VVDGLPFSPPGLMEAREAHYKRFFGPIDSVNHSTDAKPIHVDIYQFAPSDDRDYWVLVTGGMSDLRMPLPTDPPPYVTGYSEILMYVREPQGWMMSVMKGLAEMPFDDDTFVHWFHTVPNGKPMTAEPSELTSFLFLPPYFEEREVGEFDAGGNKVQLLMLVPITERERQYAIEHGVEALEDRLTEAKVEPVVDEKRASVV